MNELGMKFAFLCIYSGAGVEKSSLSAAKGMPYDYSFLVIYHSKFFRIKSDKNKSIEQQNTDFV